MASNTVLVATSGICSTNNGNERPVAKYHPNLWADRFISFNSSSLSDSKHDSYSREIQVLKQKVRDMLLNKVSKTLEKITLIYTLCRLGVSYHFEEKIEENLKLMFDEEPNLFINNDYDLYTCALVFMVFRQHGFRMSSEIFTKFTEEDGKFKETLSNDIKGILCLYEASHLRVHGEPILDEAIVFTTTCLKSFAQAHDSSHPLRADSTASKIIESSMHALAKQVLQALHQPLHRGMPRLESRRFISFYEEDETRNEMLLTFAKLDFNLLQLLHQRELGYMQKWWKESNFSSELSYVRDRVVEGYFWMSGVYYEPQHSRARIFLTKVLCFVAVLDDIYDAYSTFEESKLLTDAIQRWETGARERLPKHMHIFYDKLLSLYEEMETEVREEGRSYYVDYAKECMKELARLYFKEVEWLNKDYIPLFDEYIKISSKSIGAPILAVSLFVGMEMVGKDVFDWLQSGPICVKSCGIIARLMDDLAGHKFELERKHIATSVECYMVQHGASEEEVVIEFNSRIENEWKDLYEECLSPEGVSKYNLMLIHKLTRTTDVIYKSKKDIFTSPNKDMESYINLLFIDSI